MPKYELMKLPYAYNALEPFFDEATMKLHHDKHHQTYVDKLNSTLDKHPELFDNKLDDLLKKLNSVPEDIKGQVKNFGGGTYNHNFFWQLLKKDVKLENGKLLGAINKDFKSFDEFKKLFSASALALFGSGWTWLVKDKSGKLSIINLPNQDCPLSQGLTRLFL